VVLAQVRSCHYEVKQLVLRLDLKTVSVMDSVFKNTAQVIYDAINI